jgi:hypothetical protein
MIAGRILGTTRDLGKSQGYIGLPVRDVIVRCTVNGLVPAMETAWHPTPDEIARIVVGAPVVLRVLGDEHPPVSVDVGEVPHE